MQYSSTLFLAALAVTSVFSHGTISSIEGATGASMAGFSSVHTTRRNCASCRGLTETDSSISRKVSIADTEKIGSVTKIDEAEVEDATVTPSIKADGGMNTAAVGPFGGFFGVSRSQAEEHRAIGLNLSKRHFTRALANRNAEEDAPAAAAIAELEKIGSATKDDEAEN